MREAVWIEIHLIIVLMIANMALLGTGNSLTDALAVVALALFVSFMLGSRPVIDRRPYGAAISVDGKRIDQVTPAQIPLALGVYSIMIEKGGRQATEQVEIKNGMTTRKIILGQ